MFTKPLLWSASKVKHINKKSFSPCLKLFLSVPPPPRTVAFNFKKKCTRGFDTSIAGNIQVGNNMSLHRCGLNTFGCLEFGVLFAACRSPWLKLKKNCKGLKIYSV